VPRQWTGQVFELYISLLLLPLLLLLAPIICLLLFLHQPVCQAV
jgi:hypothetical protein